MLIPTHPADEAMRIQELRSLAILDTPEESLFDDIVKLGAYITGCPISLISLIDADRQWFKAREGLDAQQTHRDISFCGHAIHSDDTFIVENALEDERFADNPLVTGDPSIRFYAGKPLVTKRGYRIGTLCAIDRVPRKLSAKKLELMKCLARQAVFLIEQRKQGRMLEMTRRNSQMLFDKSPLIIASMKGPTHIFEYVNNFDSKLLGGTNAIGKAFAEVRREAQENGFLAVLDRVFESGETYSLKDSTFQVADELRHFDLVITPRFGLENEVDGVMGMIDDITDRKNMEHELEKLHLQRELKLRKIAELLEQVPIHIALFEGPDHHFAFANRLFRDLFLKSKSYEGVAVGKLFFAFKGQDFAAILEDVFRTGVTQVGKEADFEQSLPSGEVKKFIFNFIYEPTKNTSGHITGVLVAIADVTEQVLSREKISEKVEELRNEKEIREHFVTTLSHDLQNPLAAAKVGADRLKRKEHDLATVRKIADRIITNINRTEHMVRNLLDANRIKAGEGLPIKPVFCCLNDIIEETAQGLTALSGRALQIESRSGTIRGAWDVDGVRRVIENLASNAIKYGAPDTPIVLASSRCDDGVLLSVHNQGRPIPKHQQRELFDAYRRLDHGIETGKQGWGIGLTLVKGIAQAHRGTVKLESDEGRGTTFYVRLPLITQGAAGAAVGDHPVRLTASETTKD